MIKFHTQGLHSLQEIQKFSDYLCTEDIHLFIKRKIQLSNSLLKLHLIHVLFIIIIIIIKRI